MMFELTQAGIVGFGGMGQRHMKAYDKIGCPVMAICDFNPSKVIDSLPDFPKDRIYHDYKDMISSEKLDILSVASNSPTHAEIAIHAAEAGVRRILVEKPVSTSLHSAEKLLETVSRTGAKVAVNHIRRWSQNYKKLLERIGEDLIGEPRHAYFHCGSTGLGNFGTHFFDLMRMVSGSEATWVMAGIDQTGTPNVRGSQFNDPAGFGVVIFKNGFRGFLDCSEDTGVQYLTIIAGEYGRIIIDELNAIWTVRARPIGKSRECPFTQYPERTEEIPFSVEPHDVSSLTANALRQLLGDGQISCTVEDGIKALEMIMAFHESHDRGNERINLPLSFNERNRVVEIA